MKYAEQHERSSMYEAQMQMYTQTRARARSTVILNGGQQEDGRVNLLVLIDSK